VSAVYIPGFVTVEREGLRLPRPIRRSPPRRARTVWVALRPEKIALTHGRPPPTRFEKRCRRRRHRCGLSRPRLSLYKVRLDDGLVVKVAAMNASRRSCVVRFMRTIACGCHGAPDAGCGVKRMKPAKAPGWKERLVVWGAPTRGSPSSSCWPFLIVLKISLSQSTLTLATLCARCSIRPAAGTR